MTRKMKDSGVEWIGYMNTCWKTMPLKFILKERRQKNSPIITKERLSLSIGVGVTLYSEKTTNLDRFKDDVTQYKVAYPNDLVINSMNVIVGAEGISNYLGCVSPAYYVMYSSNPQKFVTKYYDYCFKTSTIQKALFYLGKGIMAIDRGEGRVNTCRLKVSSYDLGRLEFPVPSVNEQHRIVEFLDNRCNKIDQTIEKEKQVIEKLKEYKQSVITEAVTKGLNHDVSMKDSGVEWIGEIPEHWNMIRIKNILMFNPTYSENLNDDDNVSFIPMECLKNNRIEPKVSELSKVKGGYTYFANNDIIMAKVTPCFENGNIAVTKNLVNNIGFGSSELYVFRCTKSYTRFIFYYLQNNIFKQRCISTMYGTGGLKRVSSNFIFNYKLAIPDNEEQQQIADYLDKKCSSIDKIISNKEKVIKKLTEYKKSLIYECVTGKREA